MPVKGPVIVIQYVGPSDKLVTPIVIARFKGDADWVTITALKIWDMEMEMTRVHVVSSALMKKLIFSVDKHQEVRAETASFLLTVVKGDQVSTNHLALHDGLEVLERLAKSSRGCPALERDITYFRGLAVQYSGPE